MFDFFFPLKKATYQSIRKRIDWYVARTNQIAAVGCVSRTNEITALGLACTNQSFVPRVNHNEIRVLLDNAMEPLSSDACQFEISKEL